MVVHQPHNAQDDPNNKLSSPWRGPYQVRHRLSPVVYRVSKDGDSTETSVRLGRMKQYHQRSVFADHDFSEISQMFLGTKLPIPNLDKEASPVCIGPRTVEMIVGHKRARGRSSRLVFTFVSVSVEKVRTVMVGITVANFPTAVNVFDHICEHSGCLP